MFVWSMYYANGAPSTERHSCLNCYCLQINLTLHPAVLPYNTICNENDDNDDDSDDDLEDEIELRMERDGQRVTLRLKKNDNVGDDVPVFASKDNVMRKLNAREIPLSISIKIPGSLCILFGSEFSRPSTHLLKFRELHLKHSLAVILLKYSLVSYIWITCFLSCSGTGKNV